MSFYAARPRIVDSCCDALVSCSPPGIARLATFAVLVDTRHPPHLVAVVSGGGSGHEPSHAALVGRGLLTAAVCGDIFASPSVAAVEAALDALGGAPTLLVVKCYTGDRLTFGLAAERARLLGRDVRVVVVADDVALPHVVHPRGLAGTLFVHKLAGHLAARAQPLAAVHESCQALAAQVRTIGIALRECSVPGRPATTAPERLAQGHAELGMGIHGEPGASVVQLEELPRTVAMMVERLAPAPHARLALLVNNLGGCSVLEMQCIVEQALQALPGVELLMCGSLMTSLDARGFSLSLLNLAAGPALWEEALLEPVECAAWPGFVRVRRNVPRLATAVRPSSLLHTGATPSTEAGSWLQRGVCLVIDALELAEAELNRLDAVVGDGDTGTTMATGCRAVRAALPRIPFDDLCSALQALADVIAASMGGSSGVLLAIHLTAAAERAKAGATLWTALREGLERVRVYGGAWVGARTALDALVPALECARLADALRAARAGCQSTASMRVASAGRSAYVAAQHLEGTCDPGAVAVVRALEALAALDSV